MEERKELAPEEAADLGRLWRKLVELFHPDRFASDPVQQATYEKLTAAINHAKDNGDLVTLRKIAEDPQGFILRQGWASLDFADTEQLAQLRRLWVLLLRCCAGGVRLFFLFFQCKQLLGSGNAIGVMLMNGVLQLLMIFLHMLFVLLLVELVLVLR